MSPSSEKHKIHKFERVKLGSKGYKVYKCVLPNCPTYYREELIFGMITVCWRCGKEFTVTKAEARMKKPHCIHCTRPYIRKETNGNEDQGVQRAE